MRIDARSEKTVIGAQPQCFLRSRARQLQRTLDSSNADARVSSTGIQDIVSLTANIAMPVARRAKRRSATLRAPESETAACGATDNGLSPCPDNRIFSYRATYHHDLLIERTRVPEDKSVLAR